MDTEKFVSKEDFQKSINLLNIKFNKVVEIILSNKDNDSIFLIKDIVNGNNGQDKDAIIEELQQQIKVLNDRVNTLETHLVHILTVINNACSKPLKLSIVKK